MSGGDGIALAELAYRLACKRADKAESRAEQAEAELARALRSLGVAADLLDRAQAFIDLLALRTETQAMDDVRERIGAYTTGRAAA